MASTPRLSRETLVHNIHRSSGEYASSILLTLPAPRSFGSGALDNSQWQLSTDCGHWRRVVTSVNSRDWQSTAGGIEMATLAKQPLIHAVGDERFFLRGAILMAAIIVAGFSFQLAMGRSTFASPLRVHVHAILFMGWVAIYLTQNVLVATGRIGLHRRLGWLAAAWSIAMVISGLAVTIVMVRNGMVPFFFQPLQFLVFDPVAVLAFSGLTAAAILLRRRTEWHRRLHFCGMAMLLAPAFGRMLPMPLLQPWAWEATFAVTLLFPLAGAWSDIRRNGLVHPAWRWGVTTMLASLIMTQAVAYGPLGIPLYEAVTAGSPGADIDPLAFPPPPEGPLMTGRS